MSNETAGRVVSLGDLLPGMQERLERARAQHQAGRAERVAANAARYGTSPDAACEWCGDTGRVLETGAICFCPAGAAVDRYAELRARWEAVAVPRRLRDYTLAGHPNPAAVAAVRAWLGPAPAVPPVPPAASPVPRANLFVAGPVGTGKTGLAIGALRALAERGVRRLRFAAVPDLLDRMRPGSPADGMEGVKRASVLVLDDLGVEKPSEWVQERLYVLLNARYADGLPTIVTSNLDLGSLAAALGERAVSRFAQDHVAVVLDGPDLRRKS